MHKPTALQHRLILCHSCYQMNQVPPHSTGQRCVCMRCSATLHARKPNSLTRTWALTLAGLVLFIPANLLPIMKVFSLGTVTADTIVMGVVHLMQAGMVPIAMVVLIASVLVPLFKLIGLLFLLMVIQCRWQLSYRQCTALFHMIHFIGRWSMLDLFIIAILADLVDFGRVASIEAGLGATAFAAVVVLTMLAALAFDTRLIWDLQHD